MHRSVRLTVGWGVFAVTCGLVAAGGWLGAYGGQRGYPDDAVLALAFTATGALIIGRGGNRLGWLALLMALSGVAYAADSYAGFADRHHTPGGPWAAWVASWIWAPAWLSIATVALLVVPTGRLPSARWRPLLAATWAAIVAFTVLAALLPEQTPDTAGEPFVPPGWAAQVRKGLPIALALLLLLALGCLAGLVTRVRRARGVERLQLAWICAGGVVTVAMSFGSGVLPPGWSVAVQSAGALVLPACLGVAVLRHDLYDVDPVLRRSLTYALLAALLLAVALGLTAAGGFVFGAGRPTGTVLTTIVIALLVNPLYRRTRRWVDRMLYGRRGDPYAVMSDLGRRLSATTDPEQVLRAVADAAAGTVRSPYVQVEAGGGPLRVDRGTASPFTAEIPLAFQGTTLGWLRLAPRRPGEPFDPRDMALLADVARQASAAVCAAVTELDLRAARDRLVRAREDERRRLRRDLHDGVGPVLAGLGFTAEAAARSLPGDPERAARLLSDVHRQAATAVATIRRISRDLQPHVLAEMGLADAIRHLGQPLLDAGIGWTATLPPDLPELPAAVEVAVYSVAAEAVTNAVRHSGATRIHVELEDAEGRVRLLVRDDGTGMPDRVEPGVGLASMRARAQELGGEFAVASGGTAGTTVSVCLPLPREA